MLIRGLSSTYLWHLLYGVGMFFAPKFCTDTMLHFWVTTCQGIVQYANRYTKASFRVPGDPLLDNSMQNHNLQESS